MEHGTNREQFSRINLVERLDGDTFMERLNSLATSLGIPHRARTRWLKDLAGLSKPGAHKWFNSEDQDFCPHESSLDNFIDELYGKYDLPVKMEEMKSWLVRDETFGSDRKKQPHLADSTSIYISHIIYQTLGETIDNLSNESLSHILNGAINYYEQTSVNEEGLRMLIQGMAHSSTIPQR